MDDDGSAGIHSFVRKPHKTKITRYDSIRYYTIRYDTPLTEIGIITGFGHITPHNFANVIVFYCPFHEFAIIGAPVHGLNNDRQCQYRCQKGTEKHRCE